MNKRGKWEIEPGIAWFFLIIILVLVTMWVGTWGCRNDSDCGANEICTVKHACFKPEVSETIVVKTANKFLLTGIILGICIIIAAIILKYEDLKISHHIHKIRKKFHK